MPVIATAAPPRRIDLLLQSPMATTQLASRLGRMGDPRFRVRRSECSPWTSNDARADVGRIRSTERCTHGGTFCINHAGRSPARRSSPAFAWSLQHSFMPLTFNAKFMAFRLLSSVPNTVFQTILYLRLRRLIPLAIAHAMMDGASVLIGVLLPLMRA